MAPFGLTSPDEPVDLEVVAAPRLTPVNSTTNILITSYPNGVSNTLKLEVPDGEAVTDVSLRMTPKILPRSEGHSFSASADFNQTDAIAEAVDYNGSGLSVSAIDEYWSFEQSSGLPPGWTTTNTNFGLINTMSCGTNGSSSRSLTIRHGTVAVTSNTIDLGSLSQGVMAFWMREGQSGCGEDPDSSEHMYVEYKRSSGSWGQITYFNAGLGYPYYTPRNVQFNLPSDAFHSTFQFRFRMPYGSGTCCDWWFVDDVRLTKPGGSGNWTTPSFGANATRPNFRTTPGPYGVISLDWDAPANAVSWSVLDGSTKTPLHGFDGRTDTWADLGAIDWVKHPSIRVKVRLAAAGTGSSTRVNSVHIQGVLADSFDRDPYSHGWTNNGLSWDGDSLSGSGNATSPEYHSRRPISRIAANIQATGSGQLYGSFDGGAWITLANTGTTVIPEHAHTARFTWAATTASTDLTQFTVDLEGGGLPLHPQIDLALDGRQEWGLLNDSIGPWGWQDRLATGSVSKDLTWSAPGPQIEDLWLSKHSDGTLTFDVSPHRNSGVDDLEVELLVSGNTVLSRSLGSPTASQTITMTMGEKANLAAELASATPVWRQGDIQFVNAEIHITASNGGVRLGGIAAPYHPTVELDFYSDDDFVLAVNDALPYSMLSGNKRIVPLPITWELPAAMEVTITKLDSSAGWSIDALGITNASNTLVPSWQWIEISTQQMLTQGTPSSIQYDFIGEQASIRLEAPVSGGAPVMSGDVDLIELHPTNPSTVVWNGSSVSTVLRFRTDAVWDDEEIVHLYVRGVGADGLRTIPAIHVFGVGPELGIENDVLIREWRMLNDQGAEIPEDASYLKADSDVTVQVDLGFEDTDEAYGPRTGEVSVTLLQDGNTLSDTTVLSSGRATFSIRTPEVVGMIEYEVNIMPLYGGDDVTSIMLNRSFEIDSLAPQMVNQSVARHDHLEPSMTQTLTFDVFDHPVLPEHLNLMLWQEWADDANYDGIPDADEFQSSPLIPPDNRTQQQGNYSFTFDDTYGVEGDIVAGYVTGADAAGNLITDAGSAQVDDQLFTYQLMADGAPEIPLFGASWDSEGREWLHPTTNYTLTIPFHEPNGHSDITEAILQLASNSALDLLEITWQGGSCVETSEHLTVIDCGIRASEGDLTPFTSDLELYVEIRMGWGLPMENDLRREPSLAIIDRAGQGDWLTLPELRWRFSADLRIDPDTLLLELDEGTTSHDGGWVAPGSDIHVSGMISFVPTGDVPTERIRVEVLLDDERKVVRADNGLWSADLRAPLTGGPPFPLTVGLTDLPPQARDLTDPGLTEFQIIVDDTPPEPVELTGPRLDSAIPVSSLQSLTVELKVNEQEQLDIDSVRLNWRVTVGSNPEGEEVNSGAETMTLPAHNAAGEEIPLRATFDLNSMIPGTRLVEPLALHIWVTGADMVGHAMVSDIQFNSPSKPFASWSIQQLHSEMVMGEDDLIYSHKGEIDLGDEVLLTVRMLNEGEIYGFANVTLTEIHSDGSTRTLTTIPELIQAAPGEVGSMQFGWTPDRLGHVWVVVSVDGEQTVTGDSIHVVDPGGADGVLGQLEERGITQQLLMVLAVMAVVLVAIAFMAIRSKGAVHSEDGDLTGEVEAQMAADDSATQQATAEQWAQWQQWQVYAQQQQAGYGEYDPTQQGWGGYDQQQYWDQYRQQ